MRRGDPHRDIKPENFLVCSGKLLLIYFGSAAAMGMQERVGYDYSKSPCDPRYAPPEQFIDEVEWAKYDVYTVGLILVRILFPPLWNGKRFNHFSDSYHASGYELDTWLSRYATSLSLLNERDNQRGKKKRRERWLDESLPLSLRPRTYSNENKPDEGSARDQGYVDLAAGCCSFPEEDSLRSERQQDMCALKEGLEILNSRHGGVCWETMRRILERDPKVRMSSTVALEWVDGEEEVVVVEEEFT